MRLTVLGLSLFAVACGASGLDSPTSPTSAAVSSVPSGSLGSAQSQAQLGSELPFKGSFTGLSSSVTDCPPTCPPTTLTITGTQEGTATHLGRYVATIVDVVDIATETGTGTIDFTAANGDLMHTTTAGGQVAFTPPNISSVVLTATVTGGTGRFAGATGTFTVRFTGEIDFVNATSSMSGDLQGYITLRR